MATDYRQKTRKVLNYMARKVDEEVIKEYKPKRWCLEHTGASGTPEEHPGSDIDINFSLSKETLDKYEASVIGPRCAAIQAEARRMADGRDVTIWLQEIEDFDNAKNYRMYSRNSARYGKTDEEKYVGKSNIPAPIANKTVLAQWAMKEQKYSNATFLGGSENILEKVRRDPTLYERVPWEGYEMAVRGMTDLVTALSEMDSIKTSKSILRMAHSLHISLGRPPLNSYGEVEQASHGILGGEEKYEALVSEAKERRDAAISGVIGKYDFGNDAFTDVLLEFATLCKHETKNAAYREGYFLMPERVACMDFYINSSMVEAAKNITKGAASARKFSGLLAGEIVDLFIRYDRVTTGFERFSTKSAATGLEKEPWVERLSRINVPTMLTDKEMKDARLWMAGADTSENVVKGKILLATGKKSDAITYLDKAIAEETSGDGASFVSYTIPTGHMLADLYIYRGDATNDHTEAAKYYEMSLMEDALNPYCWHRLSNLLGKPAYKEISVLVGEAMTTGNPWQAYNLLYLDPEKIDEHAIEIWETSHRKRVEHFEKYTELLETDVKNYEHGARHDDLPEAYRDFCDGMKECRNKILKHRAMVARALVNFLKTDYSPLFGILIDQFERDYDSQTKRYFEKADMWRRKTAVHVRSGEADDGEE